MATAAERVSLEEASRYAGSPTPWTPENAQEVGLDPNKGFSDPQQTVQAKQPLTDLAFGAPLDIPRHSFPDVPETKGGAPITEPATEKAYTPPADFKPVDKNIVEKAYVPPSDYKPAAKAETTEAKPADSTVEKAYVPPTSFKPVAQQQQVQPELARKPLEVPTPTPEGPTTTEELDPHAQQRSLVDQGYTPGHAQAIVAGQESKTISGEPPKTIVEPKAQAVEPEAPKVPVPVEEDPVLKHYREVGRQAALAEAPQPPSAPQQPPQMIEYSANPNAYTKGRGGNHIQNIIIHSSDGSEKGDVNQLTQHLSSHYYVTRDGRVYHFVNDEDSAHHAGKTTDNNRYGNSATLGIEQEHVDGKQDWPEAQVRATARLTSYLENKYGLGNSNVLKHSDIAPERKVDPIDYPWDNFYKYVAESGGGVGKGIAGHGGGAALPKSTAGLNVTHFGYKTDPYLDPESAKGHGKYVQNMIAGYDVALNKAGAAKIGNPKPGDKFTYDGREFRYGDAVPEKYADARFDVFDPNFGGREAESGGGGGGGGGKPSLADQPIGTIPTSGGTPQLPQEAAKGGAWAGDTGSTPQPQTAQATQSVGGFFPVFPVFGGGGGKTKAKQAAPEEEEEEEDPMVTALMTRGFTRAQALKFALSSQALISPIGLRTGVRTQPPPAPTQLLTAKPLALPPPAPSAATATGTSVKPSPPGVTLPSKQPQIPARKVPPTPTAASADKQSVVQALTGMGIKKAHAQQLVANVPGTNVDELLRNALRAHGQSARAVESGSFRAPQETPPPAPTPKAPVPEPEPRPAEQPTPYPTTGGTHGVANPPSFANLTPGLKLSEAVKQHATLLSEDDPRVKKQADGMTKGEHFVPGDPIHDQLLNGLPEGQGGRQHQILGEAEQAITEKRPMHISYLSAPKEAQRYPTRESRMVQYDEHSPEARLMGTTVGQLVGHSFIPTAVGIKLPSKAGDPHQSYVQGISTNILANNFQHLNEKLASMGVGTPYKSLGHKFFNDVEGYFSNLNAGHSGTGRGYAIGTEHHPNEPDTSHVPYKLTHKETDFINTVMNNTAAFAKHEDAQKLRELARANGTLITEEGETNRMRHNIEQLEPGWRQRVLEPSIRTFKTGLIVAHHSGEQNMPQTIRPGKEFQDLTRAIQRTSERGRPDVPISVSLHHSFQDNRLINKIERDFSENRIDEAEARRQLEAMGEDPNEYRFHGGSGGLITPYEDDPESITPDEHAQMRDNLRKQWVGGKLNIEDYRRKAAEVPLPSKPSQAAAPSTDLPAKPQDKPEPTEAAQLPAAKPQKAQPPAAPGPTVTKGAPATPEYREAKPEEFTAARNKTTRKGFLSPLNPEDIAKHKLFMSHDGTSGAAVSPEGDIQNVFNNGGPKGAGAHAMAHAIENGGHTLDAFAPYLPHFYRQFGFKETGRMKFNRDYAPKGWDYAKDGEPDVVFMGRGGDPAESTQSALTRAKGDRNQWLEHEHSTNYSDDWESQKQASRAYAQRAGVHPVAGAQREEGTLGPGDQPRPEAGQGAGGSLEPPTAPPAPGEVPVPTKAKTKPIPVPAAQAPEKPDWETADEPTRQKYLKKRVKQILANQSTDESAIPLKALKNDDGSYKYDPQGNPTFDKPGYNIVNSPFLKKKGLDQLDDADNHEDTIDPEQHGHLNPTERRRLSALRHASAVETMGNKIFESYNAIKDIPEIAAGKGWYSRMRDKLAKALGPDNEIFAQLLGATSAKTPVRSNFIQALDAYEKWKRGDFDRHAQKYLEAHHKMEEGDGALTQHMRNLGILGENDPDHKTDAHAMAHWIEHHDILPKQQTGAKYNANSNAVLKVLAGTWLKEADAPKTPNFAGNLTGRTKEATIDVWAARHIKRLGHEGLTGGKPWRDQAKGESGVSGLDFAYSQDAMRHAADKIGINPDDLQAILWYAEKHHYEKQGWTRGEGAKKASFDDVFDKVFHKSGEPMNSQELRSHYAEEAKAAQQLKDKITLARQYHQSTDPKTQAKLEPYLQKHAKIGLTREHLTAAPEQEEEEEAA